MKVETTPGYVSLEAENNFDIFYIGQIHAQMKKSKLSPHTSLSNEKKYAKLSITTEEFVSYLITDL